MEGWYLVFTSKLPESQFCLRKILAKWLWLDSFIFRNFNSVSCKMRKCITRVSTADMTVYGEAFWAVRNTPFPSDRAKSPRPCICSSEVSFDFLYKLHVWGLWQRVEYVWRELRSNSPSDRLTAPKLGEEKDCISAGVLRLHVKQLMPLVFEPFFFVFLRIFSFAMYTYTHTHTTLLTQRTGIWVTPLEYFLWII